MQNLPEKHWHHQPPAEVIGLLEANPQQGLDAAAVQARQASFGPNALPTAKGRGPLLRFLLQFNQVLVYILLVATAIKLAVGAWTDASVIFGVIFLNAVIGFIQEGKALGALEALARALTTEATVLRGGQRQRIDARALVPGDIVLLASGDKVPADLRLLEVRELRVDEAALTGESLPVEKRAEPLPTDTVLADRRNMAYSSTLVHYGTATGVVVAIGKGTEIGRISELLAHTNVLATPLTRRITRFSHWLMWAILSLAALSFAVGTLVHGQSAVEMFLAAVALAVAMIPEGLVVVLTITLAIGVSRMAKRNAIIRHLPAVETLGSTTVICSDKTGTLTRNEMTVQRLWAAGLGAEVSGVGYEPQGALSQAGQALAELPPALEELLRTGLLCNDAVLREDGGSWRIEGDPTEGALLVAARKAGLHEAGQAAAHPRLDALAFESQHQYMATLHGGAQPVVYMKGAVEAVLARCDCAIGPDAASQPLDADAVQAEVEAMARLGLRVLAFARRSGAGLARIGHGEVGSGLEFVGLQGMIDPPRAEAVRAVQACHTAGIRVKMITGDHAVTAAAIAAEIGLDPRASRERPPRALSGRQLEALDEAAFEAAAAETAVFARVTPEQKLRLVQALQARGEVVAMTGDGVNDAPALKRANIGVAMGITGTEVSKEAAAMVLTDDNFASIEAAVEEGRGVFDNIVKFISWILPTNAGQGLVIIAAILAAQPLPILPVQALWINMTTAVLLGLTLCFEPREAGIMLRPPRRPDAPILNWELVLRILIVGVMLMLGATVLFHHALARGLTESEARTIALAVFAVGQSFYLLNMRSLRHSMWKLGLMSNPWIWVGIAAMMGSQLLVTYVPVMNTMFHTAPIAASEWLPVLAVGLAIHLVVGAEKLLRKTLEARAAAG
ncbi:cation transport ATPase [Serpentinimonas raichei]|uniref:Cation transport ATPase n=1 Tax=Serpentinimonas raichei TaxID=1458425 RepID=A0A060NKM5_9BURK|nr:cation-transporting P-type ATPase [Serpentinimonas raichei]BAO81835.1 cation transport ATPase [Serpentinimonas raichei]